MLSKQQQKDKSQDKHRTLNTILIGLLLIVISFGAYGISNKFAELTYEEHKTSEIAQLVQDEGYKKCIYNDSRGFKTIGFGHLMLPTDTFKCITPQQAVKLLRMDYAKAETSVDATYYWSHGEVRLVLINMTYQLGSTGVSKFKKTLEHMQDEEYDNAASELLDSRWAAQTPNRASRLAGRILAIPTK